jgi:hypothetical protein
MKLRIHDGFAFNKFVTTDIYEKVKIRRLKFENEKIDILILIYAKCNKNASAVACLCR